MHIEQKAQSVRVIILYYRVCCFTARYGSLVMNNKTQMMTSVDEINECYTSK